MIQKLLENEKKIMKDFKEALLQEEKDKLLLKGTTKIKKDVLSKDVVSKYKIFGKTLKKPIDNLDDSFLKDYFNQQIKNRIQTKEDEIKRFSLDCYPIIDSKVITLIKDFIEFKVNYGTETEKKFYTRNFSILELEEDQLISKFINRLLFKRPKTFQTESDQYKFRTSIQITPDSYGGQYHYDNIQNNASLFSIKQLRLEETISYDEMQIAALVSMSWKTPILNDGDRFNGTNPITQKVCFRSYLCRLYWG